jgi:hypothetical protein
LHARTSCAAAAVLGGPGDRPDLAKGGPALLERALLYRFHWSYRKDGKSLAEYRAWAKQELRPVLQRILDIAIGGEILVP